MCRSDRPTLRLTAIGQMWVLGDARVGSEAADIFALLQRTVPSGQNALGERLQAAKLATEPRLEVANPWVALPKRFSV